MHSRFLIRSSVTTMKTGFIHNMYTHSREREREFDEKWSPGLALRRVKLEIRDAFWYEWLFGERLEMKNYADAQFGRRKTGKGEPLLFSIIFASRKGWVWKRRHTQCRKRERGRIKCFLQTNQPHFCVLNTCHFNSLSRLFAPLARLIGPNDGCCCEDFVKMLNAPIICVPIVICFSFCAEK